jgi:hypothetical protein
MLKNKDLKERLEEVGRNQVRATLHCVLFRDKNGIQFVRRKSPNRGIEFRSLPFMLKWRKGQVVYNPKRTTQCQVVFMSECIHLLTDTCRYVVLP